MLLYYCYDYYVYSSRCTVAGTVCARSYIRLFRKLEIAEIEKNLFRMCSPFHQHQPQSEDVFVCDYVKDKDQARIIAHHPHPYTPKPKPNLNPLRSPWPNTDLSPATSPTSFNFSGVNRCCAEEGDKKDFRDETFVCGHCFFFALED